jgi:SAM-dependent methyltransferase
MTNLTPAERLSAFVEAHGPWETHNVYLGDGCWTISGQTPVPDLRLRRLVQIVHDLSRRPLGELRVLDLASGEGLFGIELARRGAEVVAVEGREMHVRRARFAAETLGLDRYEVVHADIREVSRDRFGEFDGVLCLGILYHLDAPDVFEVLATAAELCRHLTVVDTWVGGAPEAERSWRGRRYSGSVVFEHRPEQDPAERLDAVQMSLDNELSFWLTKPSLQNVLVDVGFASVVEAVAPRTVPLPIDEVVLAAIKGEVQEIEGIDPGSFVAWPALPEDERRPRHPTQTVRGRLRRRAGTLVRRGS